MIMKDKKDIHKKTEEIMRRKTKKIVFILILILMLGIIIFNTIDKTSIEKKQIKAVMSSFHTQDEQNLQNQEIEKQIQAVMETAYAYERQGTQLQYDSYRKNLNATPEDATSQHPVYTVCSGLVYQTYYQALGIKLPAGGSGDLLDYAEANKDNNDVVLKYYGSEDDIYCEGVLGTKGLTDEELAAGLKALEREWSNFLKPGDIFVVTGHAMLIESVDIANGEVTIIETGNGAAGKNTAAEYITGDDENDKENFGTHKEVWETDGTIRRMNLKEKLTVYYNKYNKRR